MAVTYLEPIPELHGKKAVKFEKKMKEIKPVNLTKKELSLLKTIQIDGKKIINLPK